MMLPSRAQQESEAHRKQCSELTSMLHAKVRAAGFLAESARLIEESTAYDRLGLKNFLEKIDADQATYQSGVTDTLSIAKAKEKTSPAPAMVSA